MLILTQKGDFAMSKEKLNLSEMSQVCGGWFITGNQNSPRLTTSQEEYLQLKKFGHNLNLIFVNDDKFTFNLPQNIKYSDLRNMLGPEEL